MKPNINWLPRHASALRGGGMFHFTSSVQVFGLHVWMCTTYMPAEDKGVDGGDGGGGGAKEGEGRTGLVCQMENIFK